MTAAKLKVLLALSVVVNLFALGVIGGGAAMWIATSTRHPLRAAGDTLPSVDRVRFHQMFKAVAQQVRPLQKSARQNRRVAALLFVSAVFRWASCRASLITRARCRSGGANRG